MLSFDMPIVESVLALPKLQNPRRVVFVCVPNGDPFDLVGPLAVLREANYILEQSGRQDLCYQFEVVSNEPGAIFEIDGMKIVVDTSCYDVQGSIDTVVFQAIDWDGDCLNDKKFIKWISQISENSRRVVGACIGTYALAEAGLLDGRRAATHWAADRDFRCRYPAVDLDIDPIYVKDGRYYTSAGITSILDLMLALVEEDCGCGLAVSVAQGMVMFLRRPANQAQFSVQLTARPTDNHKIRGVLSFINEHMHDDLSVENLAETINMSSRNFTRVFAKEVGMTPGKFVELSRLESARRCLEQTKDSVERVAIKCGYSTPDGLRVAFDRSLGITPREYRARFS